MRVIRRKTCERLICACSQHDYSQHLWLITITSTTEEPAVLSAGKTENQAFPACGYSDCCKTGHITKVSPIWVF